MRDSHPALVGASVRGSRLWSHMRGGNFLIRPVTTDCNSKSLNRTSNGVPKSAMAKDCGGTRSIEFKWVVDCSERSASCRRVRALSLTYPATFIAATPLEFVSAVSRRTWITQFYMCNDWSPQRVDIVNRTNR